MTEANAGKAGMIGRLWEKTREHASNAVVGGGILVLTGFTPEHWVAEILHRLRLPDVRSFWPSFVDGRLFVLSVGVAVIVGDMLWRSHRTATPAVIAPAATTPGSGGAPEVLAAPAGDALPLPDKPSIAVLPFANMSGDKDQDFFANGIVEDVITALGQVSSLFVVARNSSFAFRDKSIDLREVGRQLGVRYILEGSLQRSGDRLRVTVQLLDTRDGGYIWTERYDRPLKDIFDIQDDITKEIVTTLRIKLTDGEEARIWSRATNNIEAWSYATRGVDHLMRGTAEDNAQARILLQRAVEFDPKFARATAFIALSYYYDYRFKYAGSAEGAKSKAAEFTAKAVALDPEEPYVLLMSGLVKGLQGDFDGAVDDVRAAVARTPNDAFCWAAMARLLVNHEKAEEGERAIRRAIRLNPRTPGNYLAVLGDALVHLGRNEEAIEVLKKLVQKNPAYISAHLHLAGLYGSLGDWPRARSEIAEVLRLDPQYRLASAAAFYLSSNENRKQAFLDCLRAAGLPD